MARKGGKDKGLFERPAGSGVWWARWADENGDQRIQKVGGKEAARAVYMAKKDEVRRIKLGLAVRKKEAPALTVAAMFDRYREERDASVRNVREDRRLCAFWSNLYGHLEVGELKADELHRWRARRLKEVKPATVNRALTVLQAVFALAVRDGLISSNPVQQVPKLLENNERTRVLDVEQEAELIRQHMHPKRWRVVELAINTGMRRQELFSLRREEVDFRNHVVRIPETKDGPARHVWLNDRAEEILREMLGEHDSEWLLPSSRTGSHLTPHVWMSRFWRPAVKKAGVRPLTWHDLRHSFAARCVEEGQSLRVVQRLLGHKTYRSTERYGHVNEQQLRAAVQQVNTPNRDRTATATGTATGETVAPDSPEGR